MAGEESLDAICHPNLLCLCSRVACGAVGANALCSAADRRGSHARAASGTAHTAVTLARPASGGGSGVDAGSDHGCVLRAGVRTAHAAEALRLGI